jgi:hypothetical protein
LLQNEITEHKYRLENQKFDLDDEVNLLTNKIDSIRQYTFGSVNIAEKYYYDTRGNYDNLFNTQSIYRQKLVLEEADQNLTFPEQFGNMGQKIHSWLLTESESIQYSNYYLKEIRALENNVEVIYLEGIPVDVSPTIEQYSIPSLSQIKKKGTDEYNLILNMAFKISMIPDLSEAEKEVAPVAIATENEEPEVMKEPAPEEPENDYGSEEASGENSEIAPFTPLDNEGNEDQGPGETGTSSEAEASGGYIQFNGKQWKFLEDNPTSYMDYFLFKKDELEANGWRLPEYNEMEQLFHSTISSGSSLLKDKGWEFGNADYISKNYHLDNRSNKRFKCLHVAGNTISPSEVTEGDLIYIIVVKN